MLYVYLKATAELEKGNVLLNDVGTLFDTQGKDVSYLQKTIVGKTASKGISLIRSVDVVKALNCEVTMLGSSSCGVSQKQDKPKSFLSYIKVAFVVVTLFIGSMSTIMNYHNDVSMPKMHTSISVLLTGKEEYAPIMNIAYSVGIAVGVLFFGNLLPGRKVKPTIFDVEQYELDKQTGELLKNEEEQKK